MIEPADDDGGLFTIPTRPCSCFHATRCLAERALLYMIFKNGNTDGVTTKGASWGNNKHLNLCYEENKYTGYIETFFFINSTYRLEFKDSFESRGGKLRSPAPTHLLSI